MKRSVAIIGILCLSVMFFFADTQYVSASEIMTDETVSGNETNDPADPVSTVSSDDVNPDTSGNQGVTTVDDSSSGKIKLDTPTGCTWTGHWSVSWNGPAEAQGYYLVELYKDGELYRISDWSGLGENPTVNFSQDINESGTYKVRVKANANYDYENYENSDYSEFTAEKIYVKPSVSLGTTTPYWDSEKVGLIHYPSVKDAGGHLVSLYFTPAGTDYEYSVSSSWGVTPDYKMEAGYDFTEELGRSIQEHGAGKYRVTITALSGNIDEIANGVEGPYSEFYNTEKTAEDVKDVISDAIKDKEPEEALDAIVKSDVNISELQVAMQTDNDVKEQIKDLEEKYVESKNITVAEPEVSDEAAEIVDANQIKMVGAGLNVESGKVNLKVEVPDTKIDVDTNRYVNSVQLDIKLENENNSVGELKIPISITLPIPTGLNANRLTILHYSADGSFEVVSPKNNGDGTITFTVTHFSTFVFAEAKEAESGDSQTPSITPGTTSSSSVSITPVYSSKKAVSVNWDEVQSKLNAVTVGNVDAVVGNNMSVSADVINGLKGSAVTLALHTGDGIAISITGTNVKNNVDDLKINIKNNVSIPDNVKNEVLKEAWESRLISMNVTGVKNLSMGLHLALGSQNAGKMANLYCYNAVSNKMVYCGSFVINEVGQAMFAINSGAEYIVTITDKVPEITGAQYIVKSGDTLSAIAARQGISVKALMASNLNIKDPNRIYVGDVLNIMN